MVVSYLTASAGAAVFAALAVVALAPGCRGDPEKRQTPAEWIKENTIILEQLKSYDNRERHEGINRFLKLGKERGTEVVNYLLNDPGLDDYRIEVVLARILAEWKDSRAIPKLLLNLKERDSGAISIAKEGLIAFGDNLQILESMKELIADPELETRRTAAEVLSEMKAPEALKVLADRFKVEEDQDVRGICFLGVLNASPRDPRRTELLIDALSDKDVEFRQRAWDALVLLRPPVRFDPEGDPAQQVQAIQALKGWAKGKSPSKSGAGAGGGAGAGKKD